ncbi:hypothetical protein NEMBOFW57_009683 [Staphylotrichum longicolle]|uniref:Uncharacterized protein n=1 Tax=Staphylotrichum longicolle TaxID=669026 RepID=A0AAD4HXZ3_9PEZI|nr:hypothetical protein NEMBOFW57_009683 [Staphylotrichum longicolle]
MTVNTPTHLPYAHELLIAQLAVQRAALVTKRVAATIPQQPPSHADPTNPSSSSSYSAPISQFFHTTPETGYFTAPDNNPSPSTSPTTTTSPITTCTSPIAFSPPTLTPASTNLSILSDLSEPDPAPAPCSGKPDLPRRFSLAKPDKTPVTVADLAAQALLVAALHAAFPRDAILGEEDASALRADPLLARRVWELVDGTRLDDDGCEALLARPGDVDEMMRVIEGGGRGGGMDEWWCAEEKVHDAAGEGLMLSAVRGQGAVVRPLGTGTLREGRRVERGRGKVELRDVHFVDSQNSPATLTEKVRELAGRIGAAYPGGTQMYSSHMRYAAMVLGGREYVQLRWPKPTKGPWSIWDHAGSQLIYTESGAGKVTDLAGNPVDFTTGNKLSKSWGVITADESIHGKILELVNEMRAAEASA